MGSCSWVSRVCCSWSVGLLCIHSYFNPCTFHDLVLSHTPFSNRLQYFCRGSNRRYNTLVCDVSCTQPHKRSKPSFLVIGSASISTYAGLERYPDTCARGRRILDRLVPYDGPYPMWCRSWEPKWEITQSRDCTTAPSFSYYRICTKYI